MDGGEVKEMNRKLARKVAREHGVSVKEVREGIQNAIDRAYENSGELSAEFGGRKPTPDELIQHLAEKTVQTAK
jgi:hypothetical protein